MEGKFSLLSILLLSASGCVNFPGFKPDGRHRSDVIDASIFRRPGNYVADRSGDPVLQLAKQITVVEDELRRDGTITIKKPDVWGEGNLVEDLQQYDSLMKVRTGQFHETLQAYIVRSDKGELQAESSLAASLSATPPAGQSPAPLPSLPPPGRVEIKDSEPFELSKSATASLSDKSGIALEPTEVARQHSTYIDVCQALRRRHLGDDNSRSAGYGLYKVRVPVSVLPGRETSHGFSAVATLRARLNVDSSHLRYTFPKLVIADLVDSLTPRVRENWDTRPNSSATASSPSQPGFANLDLSSIAPSVTASSPPGGTQQIVDYAMPRDNAESTQSQPHDSLVQSLINGSKALQPAEITPVLLLPEIHIDQIVLYVKDNTQLAFRQQLPTDEEIRVALFKLFGSAHIVLEQNDFYSLDSDQILRIGRSVLQGRYEDVPVVTEQIDAQLQQCLQLDRAQLQAAKLLAIQNGILDQNLKRIAIRLGREGKIPGVDNSLMENSAVQFFNLDNGGEQQTVALWMAIVEHEFPLYVFSLDPQTEEQTSLDALARRRELQLALAYSVAKQPFNSSSRIAMSRQLALDANVIGLNRTVVSFAHGTDTFGWYFHPRLQAPPVESTNIGALARTIWSTGPTEHYDLRHRKLEPGIRECEVLIVMPSFVREISFEVTTNWESVAKPGVTKRSYEEMLAQGRNIHELKACMPNLSTSSCYRPGDVERLLSRIDQLEAMLGMQTYNVKLPYKFEQSGNGLFGQGRNSLKPVLNGFYGIQFLAGDNKELKARFFLRGANFHPTQTKVICGGSQSDKTTVLVHSRELISVEVSGIDSIVSNGKQGFEVRVGTPDGMSNPQFIPSANAPKSTASGFTFLTNRFDATFSNACCQSRKIALPTDKPVALSFTPTNPFPVDTERSLFCEISASNLSGTEITFGSQAKPFVRSANVVKLAYDPRGFWAVLDPIQFWKEVADALNSNLPNSTNQTFTIKVSAYVGLEKTEVTKTLNSISVVVTPCDCDEQLPSP